MSAERITFHLLTSMGREDALDRRDEVIRALEPLGIRVGFASSGLVVTLADEGVPTLAEQMNAILPVTTPPGEGE
jgi:hypothetical protein